MDKKAQKKLDVLRQKLPGLQLQLKNEKAQPDDPSEIVRLEKEIAAIQAEIAKLKE